jgi:hypothetical protein
MILIIYIRCPLYHKIQVYIKVFCDLCNQKLSPNKKKLHLLFLLLIAVKTLFIKLYEAVSVEHTDVQNCTYVLYLFV